MATPRRPLHRVRYDDNELREVCRRLPAGPFQWATFRAAVEGVGLSEGRGITHVVANSVRASLLSRGWLVYAQRGGRGRTLFQKADGPPSRAPLVSVQLEIRVKPGRGRRIEASATVTDMGEDFRAVVDEALRPLVTAALAEYARRHASS